MSLARAARRGAGRRRSPARPLGADGDGCLDRRRRGPRRRARRRGRRPRPRGRRRSRRTRPRRSPREGDGPRLRALGRVRDLAGRRPRPAWQVDAHRAARRDDRGRPRRSATSRSAPSPCRSRAASRSTPTTASPTSSAGLLRVGRRAQLRRRPAAAAARRPPRRRARARVDPGTVALARAEAARAGEPAGERQLVELRRLLGGPDPLRGLALLDELGLTPVVLPELEALRGVEQGPNHHLDVHGHTLAVLERTLEVEARPRPLRRRARRGGPRRCSTSRSPTR